MTKVDAWANERHFIDHLAPVWRALPENHRGKFFVPVALMSHAAARGVDATGVLGRGAPDARWRRTGGPVLVASIGTANAWRRGGRAVVLLNHGAGQTYVGDNGNRHPSYSGGSGRDFISLFLEPGPNAAEVTRSVYPDARVVEVGSPKLDAIHSAPSKSRTERPVVAVSTHWDCLVVPETRSALAEFADQLPALAESFDVIGHAHPRIATEARAVFERIGVPFVEDFDDVLAMADVYVCDNSSTLYEFASTGRPVVCLNSTHYRPDVSHGLRFWDAVPGVQCWPHEDLVETVTATLSETDPHRAQRVAAVACAYIACDGHAAQRSAAAIVGLIEEPQP